MIRTLRALYRFLLYASPPLVSPGAAAPVIAGVKLGLVGTFLLSRVMARLLFSITPHDPLTYLSAVGALIAVAVVACYLPARRVLRVDPAIALRAE